MHTEKKIRSRSSIIGEGESWYHQKWTVEIQIEQYAWTQFYAGILKRTTYNRKLWTGRIKNCDNE